VATPLDGGYIPPDEVATTSQWRARQTAATLHISSLVTGGPAFPNTPSHVNVTSALSMGTCVPHTPTHVKQRHIQGHLQVLMLVHQPSLDEVKPRHVTSHSRLGWGYGERRSPVRHTLLGDNTVAESGGRSRRLALWVLHFDGTAWTNAMTGCCRACLPRAPSLGQWCMGQIILLVVVVEEE
jgi:hypothetical protein